VEVYDTSPILISHNGFVTIRINVFIHASHDCIGRLFATDWVTVFGKFIVVGDIRQSEMDGNMNVFQSGVQFSHFSLFEI
jgi:hypothetical protein